jgi:hypothetical protein
MAGVPVGMRQAWVAPASWPASPAGWSPPPGWAPPPDWPAPPADWQWWRDELDSSRFASAWRGLAALIIVWTLGNLALAAELWHRSVQVHRFFATIFTTQPAGLPGSTPTALIILASFLLMCGAPLIGLAWLVIVGFRRSGPPIAAAVTVLVVLAVACDGFLLFVGPSPATTWWDHSIYQQSDEYLVSAGIAGAAALVGMILLALAVRRRRVLLLDSARHLDLS